MITGDSKEYEFFDEAIKLLKNPIGVSVEIGVRRGMGSKCIIDAYRKYHPHIKLNHLGIDPYGNILYRTADRDPGGRLDYTNKMKQEALLDLIKEYPEFNLVNLEDSEFFKRFADGYPIYNENKIMLTQYEVVHFDGPHDTDSVIKEVNFFVESDINTELRYSGANLQDTWYPKLKNTTWYDWMEEQKVSINLDNTYLYNFDYSKQNTEESLFTQAPDFNPDSQCKNTHPRRIIYSKQNNQESSADNWLVYPANNYYDIDSNMGAIVDIEAIDTFRVLVRCENGSMVFNAYDTLQLAQTSVTVGTGGMFSQRPQTFAETDTGYAGSQSKWAFNTSQHGSFFLDQKRGKVFHYFSQLEEISTNGMFDWFAENSKFKILQQIPNVNTDNPFTGIGYTSVYDNRFNLWFLTKKDYKLKNNKDLGNITLDENNNILYKGKSVDFSNKKIETLNNAKNINSTILTQLNEEIDLLKQAEKLQKANETKKSIGDFLTSRLAALLALVGIKKLIEELFKADKLVTDIASNLGVSKNVILELRSGYVKFVQTIKDGSISVQDMMEAQQSMSKELGIALAFSNDELKTWNDITKLMGVSESSAAKLMQLSKSTNISQKQYLENVLESSFAAQKQLKLQVSSQEVLETIGKLSAGILIKFQNNPIALGKAVIEAKKLGLTLEQIDKIGDSLLNWESSIESTLKAELLTGRQLNLERARAAALTGNQSDLMKEISEQIGTQKDFANLNVLAQRSLAEAFGLSRDEMSEMLLKQQLLNSYGKDAAKLNQQQFEEQQKSGLSMGEYLAQQAKQMEMQEQFNKSLDKVKQIFIDIVSGPFGSFMKSLLNILNNTLLIKTAFIGIAALIGGSLVKSLRTAAIAMRSLLALSMSKLTVDTLDMAILTAGVGALAGAAVGAYLVNSQQSEINKTPQIQNVDDGIAPASKGPFTITDSYGATAITSKGDGLAVSPNINNNSQTQYDYKRLEDKFDKLIALGLQQYEIQKQGTTLQINEFALGKASPLASAKENSRNFY